MCEIIAKCICDKCGKGIFHQVIRIVDEGKVPVWSDDGEMGKWLNTKTYHPECTEHKKSNC